MSVESEVPSRIRSEILEKKIAEYVGQGFRVVSQTETTAQLIRPKQFSFVFAVLWFFVFGIGLILYLLYFMSLNDEVLYLRAASNGRILVS